MLNYIAHTDNDKMMYLKVRAIVRTNVLEVNRESEIWGKSSDELGDCLRGIQNTIDAHPRINVGFLGSYLKYETTRNSIKIFHETSNSHKLICEVRKE